MRPVHGMAEVYSGINWLSEVGYLPFTVWYAANASMRLAPFAAVACSPKTDPCVMRVYQAAMVKETFDEQDET